MHHSRNFVIVSQQIESIATRQCKHGYLSRLPTMFYALFAYWCLFAHSVESWKPAGHCYGGRRPGVVGSTGVLWQLKAAPQRSDDVADHENLPAVRLNKVFKATHSRREADRMIQEGRVTVNGKISYGDMVIPFQDKITLNGRLVRGWEEMNGMIRPARVSTRGKSNADAVIENFEYIKYYKPKGVICTTDQRIRGNIIDALIDRGGCEPKHRVYPVGRLDKDSTGLILITSDGRLPNASLRRQQKQEKVYRVKVHQPLDEEDIDELRSGVVITTVAQRDGKSKPLTAKTKECKIRWLGAREVEITLQEGRNRQIRKMMATLGYEVVRLHRVRFGQVSLDDDMTAGDWKTLNETELKWIQSILETQES